MTGLFANPQDVAMAEEAQLRANPQQTLRGSLFNLGNVGGNAFGRGAFGTDTRTPAQHQALKKQELAKQIDFKDPNSIMKGVQLFNQGGFQAEAMALMGLLQKMPTKPTPVGPPFLKQSVDPDNPSNTYMQNFQKYSDGSVKSVGGGFGNESEEGLAGSKRIGNLKFPSKVISLDTDIKPFMQAQISGDPQFKQELFGNVNLDLSTDKGKEQLDVLTGLVVDQANQLSSIIIDPITQKYRDYAIKNGPLNERQTAHLQTLMDDEINKAIPDRNFLMREALDKVKKSRAFSGVVEDNLVMGGDDGADTLNVQNVPSAREVQTEADRRAAKAEAVAAVAKKSGKLVEGDPDKGEFRLARLEPIDARNLFGRLDEMDNDDLQLQLEAMDFKFNPELARWHRGQWNLMRAAPEAVGLYLANLDASQYDTGGSARLLQSATKNYVDQLAKSNDVVGFANASAVFKYMNRLTEKAKSKRAGGRGRGSLRIN